MKSIVIAGALAQKPGHGGHTWVFLQYLLGFRRLGWDVLFLDRLEPDMCRDSAGRACSLEQSENVRYLRDVLRRFGLGERFAIAYDSGRRWFGLEKSAVLERVRHSAALINFMGYFTDNDVLSAAPRRVFFDFDPGFGQMWCQLGQADLFRGHDSFVTVGENIGQPDCAIPTCGHRWITTPQPIVLDHWPVGEAPPGDRPFTSVGAWRGPYGPIEYHGATYGLRVHEFRKFFALPRLTGLPFEVALAIDEADGRDREALVQSGLRRADPRTVAADPWAYQQYIQRSRAEFLVAKNIYVATNSGWFSDRSLCYLASGRPVLAQDTRFRGRYPSDQGLVAFSTIEEAAAGAEAIDRDYARHATAAREIAVEYFDSNKVLSRLLAKLGIA
jgi:hypothetical protein